MNYSTELQENIVQLAHDGDLAAIKKIVKSHSKLDLNLTGTLEKSLNTACVHGYLKMAEYLVNVLHVKINEIDIEYAVANNNLEIVKLLAGHGIELGSKQIALAKKYAIDYSEDYTDMINYLNSKMRKQKIEELCQ